MNSLSSTIKVLAFTLGSAFLSGCEKPAPPAAKAPEASAATIEITGNDQMKFSLASFDVEAGQRVTVVFKNIGTMPKESMGHTWTLLDQGTNVEKFADAGFPHASNGYIAPQLKSRVLATTKLLGPGESESVAFTVPPRRGAYDYICVFPGHPAMMKGIMNVR